MSADNLDGLLVTMRHVRAARLCFAGGRDWCDRVGIDWRGFKDGIPAAELAALNDPFADRLVAAAVADREAEHG